MARIYPSDYEGPLLDGAAARERDVLKSLQLGLDDNHTVYHGLHWSRIEHGLTVLGRFQFLVLCPNGLVVAIVMKTGLLKLDEGRLLKQLGNEQQDLANAMAEQAELLSHRFEAQHGGTLHVESLLFCPDFTVPALNGLVLQAERIVDARRKDKLAEVIDSIGQALPNPIHSPSRVHAFLSNQLKLVPEVGALTQAAESLVTRLGLGLNEWVQRLHFEPFRLRVVGTAGSGKSQLALAEVLRNAQAKGRTLYVCYNRPLASHMALQLRHLQALGASAFNFHALCDRMLRDAGQEPDYSQPGVFQALPARVMALPEDRRWVFDLIVVDEGQDFEPAWLEVLTRCAHPKTRWLWLEDPSQNLYDKQPVELPGWVSLSSPMNYRNPRRVVDALQLMSRAFDLGQQGAPSVEAACPLEGLPIELMTYDDEEGLITTTAKAITFCLKQGFSRDNLVVLTLRGHEKSRVLSKNKLGPHSLRHFTGQYDDKGAQLFTEGSVYAESVYRFKGQSAQAVVVTELEFESFDLPSYRKLFVAMTRAKVMLVLVGQTRVVQRLGQALGPMHTHS
ncbi:ATP-binding domain-containing protein [Limnobacter sp.]|uniref:ATP-binding domain-containing protein n=1 Tax=Limnobacter sp. TaxID=2003368 RepID=UPI0035175E9E